MAASSICPSPTERPVLLPPTSIESPKFFPSPASRSRPGMGEERTMRSFHGTIVDLSQKGLLLRVDKGARSGEQPELASEGVGGTYVLRDTRGIAAGIFKPSDEEPCTTSNPRPGSESVRPKRGIRPGESAVREYAAYLLDHKHFSGVPATCLVEYVRSDNAKKIGSLQQYEEHEYASWDVGAQRFPVSEVHKIGILDIRLCNCDRHGGNILVREVEERGKPTLQLVPIDHGYVLPETLDEAWFDWMYWPQAHVPFGQEIVEYVRSLDADADIGMLATRLGGQDIPAACKLSLASLLNFKITTMLLKKGVAAGLTLFQIARVLCRGIDGSQMDQPSLLEKLCEQAHLDVQRENRTTDKEEGFVGRLSLLMDAALASPAAVLLNSGRRRSL